MKRRKFLKATSATAMSVPLMLNGLNVSALSSSRLSRMLNIENDKVLVLIQLNGGNDGLNTFIPLDQYDKLANARGNIIVPENELLSLTDEIGLHPNLSGMKSLYEDARLNIIQSVGYPNQNRSHFRSTDIWTTGSSAGEYLRTGWLGRYFDSIHSDYPESYPNNDYPDPIAITIGSLVSETCQGDAANFSMALTDPFSLEQIAEGEPGDVPNTHYGEELTFLRQAIVQTNAYTDIIVDAANSGGNLSTQYPEDNALAQALKTVALLIAGGLNTKVYVVTLGGFDTHANQVVDGEPANGDHAELLQTLSSAMYAFQDDLKLLGLEERVVGMTFSEFGRRIKSNDSFGTDHGTAAPLMVFGPCVNPGVLGDNPEIPEQPDVQDGVPMQFDFRSVYGSILMDWFEVDETQVKNILFDDFQYIPVLQPCSLTNTQKNLDFYTEDIECNVFPNPFVNVAHITFASRSEHVKVSVFDSLGHEIKVLTNQYLSAGQHNLTFESHNLPAGNYFLRIQMEGRQKVKGMIKR